MSEYRGTGSKSGKYGHVQYGFTHEGLKFYQLFYRAGTDINCRPPVIKGEIDSTWTPHFVDVDNEESVSFAAGMTVLPYQQGDKP